MLRCVAVLHGRRTKLLSRQGGQERFACLVGPIVGCFGNTSLRLLQCAVHIISPTVCVVAALTAPILHASIPT